MIWRRRSRRRTWTSCCWAASEPTRLSLAPAVRSLPSACCRPLRKNGTVVVTCRSVSSAGSAPPLSVTNLAEPRAGAAGATP